MRDKNPLHEAPPLLHVISSTVVPVRGAGSSSSSSYSILSGSSSSEEAVLHTLRLQHNGWTWHVPVHYAQLKDLATALRKWRWKTFFFRKLVPPFHPASTRQENGARRVRRGGRGRTHSKDDDYVDGWSHSHAAPEEEEEGVEEEGEEEVVANAPRGSSRGRGRGQERCASDRHVQRRATSAPPTSAEKEGEEEEVQMEKEEAEEPVPPLSLEHDDAAVREMDRERARWRQRNGRLKQRRAEAEGHRQRRWAYLSHHTSFSSSSSSSSSSKAMPTPQMNDVRCPLTKEQAKKTDAASVAHQRTVYEHYLRAVLDDVVNRHCPKLLEFLQVSPHTFDLAQGPSHREGRVLRCVWWSREDESAGEARQEDEKGFELKGLRPHEGKAGGILASTLGINGEKERRRLPSSATKLNNGWAVLKHSFLAFYKDGGMHAHSTSSSKRSSSRTNSSGSDSITTTVIATTTTSLPEAVLLFDTGTTLQASIFEEPTRLILRNALWHFELAFASLLDQRQWAAALATVLAQSPWVERNRFEFTRSLPMSYLDESSQSAAQWFVDGDAAYRSFEAAMRGAKNSIFLAAQWLCPDLYLLRPPHRYPHSRLDRLLEAKAQEGVQVYVLLFQEPWGGNMLWNSRQTQARLMNLAHGGRLHVLLADNSTFPQAWTHNESLLCVDQELVFVGSGLSFGLGKYDTPHHVLKDDVIVAPGRGGRRERGRRVGGMEGGEEVSAAAKERKPVWCGRDYHNPAIKDMCQVELAHTSADLPGHDRGSVPRLPQHTATVALTGGGCRDVCWHFISRWNLGRAREQVARQAIPSKRLREEEYPFAVPPALFPLHMWRVGPVAGGRQGASVATAGPWQGQRGAHTGASDIMTRKTVARLVFGASSSVALPPPVTDDEIGRVPTDVFDAVEADASRKVTEWLRPRGERVRRRLLELQHDVNTLTQAELLQYQSMVETPLAPTPRRPGGGRGRQQQQLPSVLPPLPPAPMNEDLYDDVLRGSQGRKSSTTSSQPSFVPNDLKDAKSGARAHASSSSALPFAPSKQQVLLMAEAAKQRAAAHQKHREQRQRVYQYLRLRRALYVRELEEEEEEEVSMGPLTSCHCRVVRSLGGWSGGLREPQTSILEAYEQVISTAEHFLYFENPSFISGLRGDTDVTNRLAEALLNRIVQAHDRQEAFRVMVLLPLLPAYDGSLHGATNTMLTSALYYQLTSVKALWTRLAQMVPRPEDYLQFFGLRTFSRLNGDASKQQLPHLMTEQIFVNSRLLVSDDRYAILGSAALNERSMLGSRDSEVAVVLEDTVCEPGRMNHCGYQAGTFARSLRLRLWGEHVGLLDEYVQRRVVEAALVEDQAEELLEDAPAPEDVYAPLLDPTAPATWEYLRNVARKNTAILAHVFPQALPANTIQSLEALKQVTVDGVTLQATRDFVESVLGDERAQEEEEALMEALLNEEEEASQGGERDNGERSAGGQARRDVEKEKLKWLGRLQGHLVQYPKNFLADDLASLRPINGLQGWTM